MEDNPFSLARKSVVVVGTANAIAREIAVAMGRAGATVASVDIVESGAMETADLVRAAGAESFGMRADVTKSVEMRDVVAAAVERFGGVDVLVYAAAFREPSQTILEMEESVWESTLRVNLTGAFLACKAVLPAMVARGGGNIILLASQRARIGGAGRAPYCATKGALVQFAKVLAIDHASQNIRANTLSPGSIESERTFERYGGRAAAQAHMAPLHVLGRMGRPGEIANAAVFLASEAASFMTGTDLLVDGGYTAI